MARTRDALTSMDTDTLNGRHVLVVDDDASLRHHARDVLEQLGLRVTEAVDGHQAIALADGTRFDLILLDVRMPGLDGFDTCRALRRCRADPELPIVMVTGLEDMGAITRAYRAGATDFAVKPVNWPVLTNRITWLLRNRLMARHLGLDEISRRLQMGVGRDSILQLDAEGRVEAARLATDGITGLDFALHAPLLDGLPEHALEQAAGALAALRGGSVSERFSFAVEDADTTHQVEAVLAASGGDGVLVLLRDITEQLQAERQMHRLAFYDSLTGLANLDMLRRHLADRQAGDELVGVLRLELDGLQSMRAVLGMARVDEVFRRCGQCLAELVARLAPGDNAYGEVLLGRASETGFAAVMSGFAGAGRLEVFAQRLGEALLSQCAEHTEEVALELRIGTALHRPHGADDGDLLANAELALRHSSADANQVACYTPAIREHTLARLAMVADLKQALDNCELQLVYQPKFTVDGGKLVGVEALLRWDRPGHGPVSPGCFIPLAEETGLILPLGDYVLEQACRQASLWQSASGAGLPVAVNMSRIQLNQRGLVSRIADCMQANDIARCGLEIELTESVAMQESGRVRRILAALQELGVRTAIDDFGTGHSSLGNLRDFHFHTLKVDRSFIKEVGHEPPARAILQAIIAMGHALDMEVVAEGVEEAHQLAFLRDCGCDVVQGFLTGRPQPAEDITSLLADRCGDAGVLPLPA